jgi:hypothetical protein
MRGSKEDTETVRALSQDMRARGLGVPIPVASDGAPGIIRRLRNRALGQVALPAAPDAQSRSEVPTNGRSSKLASRLATKPNAFARDRACFARRHHG